MEENLCNSCKHGEKDSNKKPCSICIQWDFDGYLDYTKYEPDNFGIDEILKGRM